MPRRSIRIATSLAAAGIAAATALIGATQAQGAPAEVDVTFMTSNAQTNLAEQTIGALALQKGQDPAVRDLATMTIADHKAAMDKLMALAQTLGVTLPTEPNDEQKAQAATLQATPAGDFDAVYAQIQVAGHTKSIANTNTELSSGADASVIAYAQGYLPVATMHLQMAQDAVAAVGAPSSVPAGSGGQRAASTDTPDWVIPVAVVGAALVALGAAMLIPRRPVA